MVFASPRLGANPVYVAVDVSLTVGALGLLLSTVAVFEFEPSSAVYGPNTQMAS